MFYLEHAGEEGYGVSAMPTAISLDQLYTIIEDGGIKLKNWGGYRDICITDATVGYVKSWNGYYEKYVYEIVIVGNTEYFTRRGYNKQNPFRVFYELNTNSEEDRDSLEEMTLAIIEEYNLPRL